MYEERILKAGIATLLMRYGRVHRRLFDHMARLAGELTTVIVDEFGMEEMLRRLSDPHPVNRANYHRSIATQEDALRPATLGDSETLAALGWLASWEEMTKPRVTKSGV